MQVTTSIWSRSLNRLFGKSPSTGTRSKASRRATTRRLVMESLENRALFAADVFGSALSIGNAQGNSSARDVATDQAGNSYLTGSFTGIVDFDNAATHAGNIDLLTSRGDKDAYVSKYAPDNSLLWVRQIGGVGLDYGAKIELDQNGNVYVSGGFSVSAIFDSTSRTSVGDIDGFVTKINTDGVFQWTTTWGTSVKDEATGIGVDSAGNAYAIGNHLVGVSYDYDILKFSPSGVVVWSKAIAAQGGLFSGDIAVSASGNVFVAGTFTGTVDFDPSSNTKYVSNGGSNSPGWAAFVLKLNTDGKYGWVSPFVGRTTTAAAGAKSLALDGSGNVVVGGFYSGSVDFNPGKGTCSLPTNGGGFVTRLNSSGGLVWARAFESSTGTGVLMGGLTVDSSGSIYAIGSFAKTIDLDPGANVFTRTRSVNGLDIFVVKLTAAGIFSWAESFSGTGYFNYGFGIAVDAMGTVHLAGDYSGTADFDPDPLYTYNLTSPGTYKSGFRLRLRQV